MADCRTQAAGGCHDDGMPVDSIYMIVKDCESTLE